MTAVHRIVLHLFGPKSAQIVRFACRIRTKQSRPLGIVYKNDLSQKLVLFAEIATEIDRCEKGQSRIWSLQVGGDERSAN
jgi:hypothetical protein